MDQTLLDHWKFEELKLANLEPVKPVALPPPKVDPLVLHRQRMLACMRKTAAHEALQICRRLFPWRLK
jgi:hypothetical protein